MIDASTTINYPPLSWPLSYLPQLPYLVAMADPASMSRILIGLILMPALILILILILMSALILIRILMPTLLLPQDLQLPYLVVMTDLGAKIFSNCFPS